MSEKQTRKRSRSPSAVPTTSYEHSALPVTSPRPSAVPATFHEQSASPNWSFGSSGSSELLLPSIGEEIQSLVTLLQTSYITTLPHSFTPNPAAVFSLEESQDSPLSVIIQSLKTLVVDENGCLDLNLSRLDDLRYNKLIVRKSYLQLARHMIGNFSTRGRKKCLLIGSPGTGKSMFLIFLLYIFVKAENVPIVIHVWDLKGFYLNGQFYTIKKFEEFRADLNNADYNPIFLYDGKSPPPNFPSSPTVVASSPRIDSYREYKKQKITYLMPLWGKKRDYSPEQLSSRGGRPAD